MGHPNVTGQGGALPCHHSLSGSALTRNAVAGSGLEITGEDAALTRGPDDLDPAHRIEVSQTEMGERRINRQVPATHFEFSDLVPRTVRTVMNGDLAADSGRIP